MTTSLKIGISACLMHPDPNRPVFAPKTLHYIEESVPHWVMAGGALPVMIPKPDGPTYRGTVTVADYAQWLDGLILHGGADVWPGNYGETALDPRWNGDQARDIYEIELVKAFVDVGKPVFGICRGLQLINVAFGGTLYQDIATQRPGSLVHRDADIYDQNLHTLELVEGTRLASLLAGDESRTINSVHHQAVKDLAPEFIVEAKCPVDGTIEAIRHTGKAWVAAAQWHPEFHKPEYGTINDDVLLQDFLNAAQTRQQAGPLHRDHR
jgi:putative glutamine amidotransferase